MFLQGRSGHASPVNAPCPEFRLLDLPNEMLLLVAEHIQHIKDLNALTQTNRRLYQLFILELYRRHVHQGENSGLLWAAEHGYEATARRFLECGARLEGRYVEQRNAYTETPLHIAAGEGHVAVVKLLLAQKGINPDAREGTKHQSPLKWAVFGNHEKVVKLLLANEGVDPNIVNGSKEGKNWSYYPPLRTAIMEQNEPMVKTLLAHKDIDPNIKSNFGSTHLRVALSTGNMAIVKLLLAHKDIDPNLRDHSELAPLHHATMNGQTEVVRMLLEKDDIDVEARNKEGQTALGIAALGEMSGGQDIGSSEAILNLLLAHEKVNADAVDNYGWSPLANAVQRNQEPLVKILLAHGVNIDSKDVEGFTPLARAARAGRANLVKLLEEHQNQHPK